MFNFNNPHVDVTPQFGSQATNGSTSVPVTSFGQAAQFIGGRFIPAASLGSGLGVNVYKNASNAASIVMSGPLGAVGINTSTPLTLSATAANTKFAANDVVIVELVGAAGVTQSTSGSVVALDYIFGYDN